MSNVLTIDEFRKFTGHKDGDDEMINGAIAAAVEMVEAELGRTLEYGERIQRHFHCSDTVLLKAYPVTEVKSVKISGVGVSGWQLDNEAGILKFPRRVYGQVEVEYTGGFETIPTAIQQAMSIVALSIMNTISNEGQTVMSERLGDYMMQYYNGASGTNSEGTARGVAALSPAAAALLNPFKDRRVLR